jgi:hypothetical protein
MRNEGLVCPQMEERGFEQEERETVVCEISN